MKVSLDRDPRETLQYLPLPSVLKEAIREVPAVKFAAGAAGIGAAGSLVLGFAGGSIQIAVLGIPVFLVLMVGVLLFAALTQAGPKILRWPMMLMVWVSTVLICASVCVLFTAWAFGWPPAVVQRMFP